MRLARRLLLLVPLLGILNGASSADAAVCAGTDAAPALCAPGTGDCVVSTNCSLPSSDLIVDLGARQLVIGANKTLTIAAPGVLRVVASGIQLQAGAKIVAEGAGTPAVQLVSTSAASGITMELGSRIVASTSGDGGTVDLESDGPVVMRGLLRAVGPNTLDSGGAVSIAARGDVLLEGGGSGVDVSGGLDGFGGDIDIVASDEGSITVQSPLKLDGGDGGGLFIDTDGDLVIAPGTLIDVDATLGGEDAGDIDISGREVTVAPTVEGTGKREDDGSNEATYNGGYGADVSIESLAGMHVDGVFDLKGGQNGAGGGFELDAVGDLTLLGKILVRAEGKYGSGGDGVVLWSESGDVTVGGTIDAAGGWLGGEIEVVSFASGGTVRLTGTANLGASALAGLPADEQLGGAISLDACTVDIQPGAVLSTTGPTGTNTLSARTSMVIAGTLQAGFENRLEYRDQPGIISILSPPAQIVPSAMQVARPTLSCCGAACVPPSTTTSSLPPTTTTSLPPTTSTSLPPSTTTTSLPVATTTTTTATLPTSTTVVTTTTTPEEPSTSTTSGPSLAPTTTLPGAPSSCSADQTQFGAATCGVTLLTARVEDATADQLGGQGTARRLQSILRRATRFLDSARGGKKVGSNLRRAQRQMKSFERTVNHGLRRKRRPIDAKVGTDMLLLSSDTGSMIGVLRASVR